MNFPSIEIQGSIISTEILSKIRSEQSTYQQGKDFNKDFTNSKLKDEISFAWQEAKGQWIIFQSKLARLKNGQTGTTETRNFWIQPLLTNLGYNLTFSKSSEEANGKQFPIGFKDSDLDGFPVYIGSFLDSLDKPPQSRLLKYSPHAMLQEYLNYSEEQDYGLVTNGKQIRLLRDATRITRLSYIEFNLEKMMEEDLYSDFVILYRLLHSSRMKKQFDEAAENIIEKYHQESLEAGSTIRSKLGYAVKQAIATLGQEFINHPKNISLRETVKNGNINSDEFYRHQLRIIYRLLFLFVIEERNLVFGESKTAELKRFNQIYFNYYSLFRLRKLAKKLPPPEASRHYDLWQSLLNTFSIFEKKEIGEKLGIMSLEGDLFNYDAICSSSYDLHQCHLSNLVILQIIKSLTYFENENKVLIAVNYGGLDVEEFGSVYEGLLELKLAISKIEGSESYSCNLESSSERSQSGSHYTPEELVQPLIKHSLEYVIEEKLQDVIASGAKQSPEQLKQSKEEALLSIKVCDVACGSGHILLSAARRISLEYARIDTGEEQPNPTALRRAMKSVVRNCIYGVDKNPLAVELCKVALWLEAHNPGEPLSFLDHHIKCGDSIVGLARIEELQNGISDEAFKTLPGDNKDITKTYREKNVKERKSKQIVLDFGEKISVEVKTVIEKYNLFKNLPERNPEEVAYKQTQYRKYESSVEHHRLKQLADAQVAQFFIPKTDSTKQYLITDSDYRVLLSSASKGLGIIQDRRIAYATTIAAKKRFFHWFLEFPEIMQEGGFNCILGNPPFLGGQRLSGTYGDEFLNWVKTEYAPAGSCDLVTYFFRRVYNLLSQKGFQSLIATNTIAQGGAREGGLDVILGKGGSINFAIRSMKWPGVATIEVSLVAIYKGTWKKEKILSNKKVNYISSYLDDVEGIGDPYPLKENEGRSFQGSIVLGNGFLLTPQEARKLIDKDAKNKDVLFQYLNGEDLNTNPDQSASRWVINFFNWPLKRVEEYFWNDLSEKEQKQIIKEKILAPPDYKLEVAFDYPDCFDIVERLVKPERMKNNDKGAREKWWQFLRMRYELYSSIMGMERVLAISRVSKYLLISFTENNLVFADQTYVIVESRIKFYSLIQNSIHNEWVWKNCSTMGSGLRYTATTSLETFPFPKSPTAGIEEELEKIGEEYHEFRRQLMIDMQLGLTKTYNLFHNAECRIKNVELAKNIREFKSAKLQIPIEEAIQRIEKLRALHKQMDEAVLKAYGWVDINLAHNFYEVDYLPENDRVRYTISPEARKEILKRLLELNHKIHAEEVAAGLWEKKGKKKKETSVVKEKQTNYGQEEMFGE